MHDPHPVQHSFSPFTKLYGHSLDEHIFLLFCDTYFFYSVIDQSGIGYRCIWFYIYGVSVLGGVGK